MHPRKRAPAGQVTENIRPWAWPPPHRRERGYSIYACLIGIVTFVRSVMEHSSTTEQTQVATLLKHRNRLLAFVRNRVNDPDLAEDIFQDALLRALRAAPEIEEEDRLIAWFFKVLRNAVIDSYRRQAADGRRVDALAKTLPEFVTPEDKAEACACMFELLPSLRADHRDLIERLDLQEEPTTDAAARLGIDRGNLKVRRHRARQELRRRLEETCRACAKHGCLDCTCK